MGDEDRVEAPSTRGMKLATGFTIALVFGLIGWTAYGSWHASELWEQAQDAVRRFRWDAAEVALAEYVQYKAEDDEVLRLRAYVAIQRGDEATALRYLERIPDFSSYAAMAYLTRARLLARQYRFDGAEAALRSCLKHDPHSTTAMRDLLAILALELRDDEYEVQAWQMFDSGMLADALDALRLLAVGTPEVPPRWLEVRMDEVSALREAIKAEPDCPHYRPALAERLAGRGAVEEAKGLIKPWLDEHPDDPAALNAWICCLMEEGELAEAERWLALAQDRASGTAAYWMRKGDWLLAAEKAGEATAAYQEAVKRRPRWMEPRSRLAQALRSAGRKEEAEQAAEDLELTLELKTMAPTPPPARPLSPKQILYAADLSRQLERKREAESWTHLTRVQPQDLLNAQRYDDPLAPRYHISPGR